MLRDIPKICTKLAKTKQSNITHRHRGRAPHEPMTLPPKQEGTTLNEESFGAAAPTSTPAIGF
jgi:hypothetical protein